MNPSPVLATKHLAEMIATDHQPYSIMENEGFVHYSRNPEPRYVTYRRLVTFRVFQVSAQTIEETLMKYTKPHQAVNGADLVSQLEAGV